MPWGPQVARLAPDIRSSRYTAIGRWTAWPFTTFLANWRRSLRGAPSGGVALVTLEPRRGRACAYAFRIRWLRSAGQFNREGYMTEQEELNDSAILGGYPPSDWRDIEDDEGTQVEEYDLTTSPNDFNIVTTFNFIQSGSVRVPGFQRNYVWDIKRASRLIESLIIGLPVPQVFLYEEDRNKFLVVDGQQRLMTIYYFVLGRFPRRDRRSEIRKIFDENSMIPDEILHNDEYFEPFSLRLPEVKPGVKNKFNRMNYKTLGDYQMQFDLRTIRNMIVKQLQPSGDTSSIYEMFNRLNTGGVLLTPQEIRSSLFHSNFYDALFRWNMDARWRRLLGRAESDLHMRDIEIMLRAFAMSRSVDDYTPSMVKFLNKFSQGTKRYSREQIDSFNRDLDWFLNQAENVEREVWLTRQSKFSVNLFESVYAAAIRRHSADPHFSLSGAIVSAIKEDLDYLNHAQERTTDTDNVKGRYAAALEVMS